MTLVSLLVVLIILGVLMYLVNTYLPMEPRFKSLVNVIVIVFVILWLVQALGLLAPLSTIRIGR